MKKICVVGSLNMDYVMNVDICPKAGETVFSNGFVANPGGKGANQAYAIGKLGGCVSMIGAVGDDAAGSALIDNLKNVGASVEGIEKTSEPTGTASIIVEADGQNRIMVYKGANSLVDRKMIDRHIDLIRECDIVVMQLEIPLDTVEYVASVAHSLGKKVILDPAPAPKENIDGILKYVDIVKPNEIEVCELAGISESPEKAARTLSLADGAKVIVTLGDQGCMLAEKDRPEVFFEAAPTEVVDTTAAGDCFTGALAMALAADCEIPKAIKFASRAAAIAVSRHGAQMAMPVMAETGGF